MLDSEAILYYADHPVEFVEDVKIVETCYTFRIKVLFF